MYCGRCGKEIPDDALFCGHCGSKVPGANKSGNTGNSQKPNKNQEPHKPGKGKIIALCLGLALLCVLAAGGSFWFLHARGQSSASVYDSSEESIQDDALEAAVSLGNGEDTPEDIQASISAVFEAAAPFTDENGYVSAEDTEDAIDAVYDAAAEASGVVSCEKDEYGVYIEVDSGLDYVYTPETEGMDSGGDELDIVTMQPFYTENKKLNAKLDHDGLDTCARDVSASDTRWEFTDNDNVDDRAVTLDRILSMDDYEMILWHGHGGYTKKTGYFLATSIEATSDLLRQYPCLNKSSAVINQSGAICLTTSFFQDNYPDNAFENAFIYLATCLSGKDRALADILVEKGAAVVFVNSDTIQRDYNLNMLHLIVESFCLGGNGTVSQEARSKLDGASFNAAENWSILDSLTLAKQVYGQKDPSWIGAEVYYVGQDGVDRLTYSEWMNGFDEQTEASAEPFVVDAWHGTASYVSSDEQGNNVQETAAYSIPKFTLDSQEVEEINNEIMDTLSQAIEDSNQEFTDAFSGPRFRSISYSWSVQNDIISLVIEVPTLAYEWVDYYVYNVSISEKKPVSRDSVVSAAGLSIEEYNQLVKQAFGSEFWDRAGPVLAEGTLPRDRYVYFQELLQDTISDDNIAQAMPFFNENGQLCAAGSYRVDAGGGTVNTIVNLDTFTLSPYYAEEIEIPENDTPTAYPPDELVSLALDYYERHHGISPAYGNVDHMEDGMYVIHLYDIVEDEAGGHTATYAWYKVDEFGIGTDTLLMTEVDLNS